MSHERDIENRLRGESGLDLTFIRIVVDPICLQINLLVSLGFSLGAALTLSLSYANDIIASTIYHIRSQVGGRM